MKQTLEIVYRNKIIYSKTSYYKEEQKFLACNWGWDGSCDGWFPAGCFNTNIIPISDNEVFYGKKNATPSKVVSGNDGNFQYKKQIYINLRPNL